MTKWTLLTIFGASLALACGGAPTTPEVPEAPEAPEVETPDTPDTPEVPETPDVSGEGEGGDEE